MILWLTPFCPLSYTHLFVFWNKTEVFCPVRDMTGTFSFMTTKVKALVAELEFLILWDRPYVENPAPDRIEQDACFARTFRRVQVVAELHELARRN